MADEIEAGALYFPYLVAPRDPWFLRVLLYWDYASVISPAGFTPGDYPIDLAGRIPPGYFDRFSYNEELVDLGLLRRIDPNQHVDQDFIRSLVEFVESTPRPQDGATRTLAPVHVGKFGTYELFPRLQAAGVAEPVEGSQFYLVQEDVAQFLIAALASEVAVARSLDPVTDEMAYLAQFAGSATAAVQGAELSVRATLLEDLLVVPGDTTDLRKIVEFKERYRDQLLAFRRRLEVEAAVLASRGLEDRERELALVRERMADEREELAAKLHEHRITARDAALAVAGIVVAGLTSLHGGDPVAVVESLAGATGLASLGAAGSIRRLVNGRNADALKRPLAYAALTST